MGKDENKRGKGCPVYASQLGSRLGSGRPRAWLPAGGAAPPNQLVDFQERVMDGFSSAQLVSEVWLGS